MADEQRIVAQIDPRLAQSLDRMGQSIDRLAESIRQGTERTVEEIHRTAEATARTEIAKQRAELKSIEPLIKKQGAQINEHAQKTIDLIGGLQKKFDKAAKDLWDSYVRDIRHLGGHIFEILEVEYQRGIEGRVRVAEFDIFTGITQKVYEKGSQNLSSWLSRARDSTKQFVGLRRQFKNTLTTYKLNHVTSRGTEFAIPVWLLKTEDETGNIAWQLVSISTLKKANEGEYRYNFQEIAEYREVADKIQANLEAILKPFHWQTCSEPEKKAIAGEINSLANNSLISGDLKKIILTGLQENTLSCLPIEL